MDGMLLRRRRCPVAQPRVVKPDRGPVDPTRLIFCCTPVCKKYIAFPRIQRPPAVRPGQKTPRGASTNKHHKKKRKKEMDLVDPREAEAQASSLDAETLDYLKHVHEHLARKEREVAALMRRFEPANPMIGPGSSRPLADSKQRPHVMRRYDEALMFLRGFRYNPHRAYFDRDAYGTGHLTFGRLKSRKSLVSLLGTHPSQDRWRRDAAPSETQLAAAGLVDRGARLDAFFAMLERRQALTELSGMAPTCVFVGQEVPTTRSPPRPINRRIPMHRYRRLCFSASTGRDGAILHDGASLP